MSSFSRPHASNDNPYSEAQVRTLKYRPDFPDRSGSLEDARTFCQGFFGSYNEEHRHSGIGWIAPASVHDGRAQQVRRQRQHVLLGACQAHRERFVRRLPVPPALPRCRSIPPPTAGERGGCTVHADLKRLTFVGNYREPGQRERKSVRPEPGSDQPQSTCKEGAFHPLPPEPKFQAPTFSLFQLASPTLSLPLSPARRCTSSHYWAAARIPAIHRPRVWGWIRITFPLTVLGGPSRVSGRSTSTVDPTGHH